MGRRGLRSALRDAGWRVSENTVAGLMREQGLAALRQEEAQGRRPARAGACGGRRTWSSGKFAAGGINCRWYGDGTEIVTGEGKPVPRLG